MFHFALQKFLMLKLFGVNRRVKVNFQSLKNWSGLNSIGKINERHQSRSIQSSKIRLNQNQNKDNVNNNQQQKQNKNQNQNQNQNQNNASLKNNNNQQQPETVKKTIVKEMRDGYNLLEKGGEFKQDFWRAFLTKEGKPLSFWHDVPLWRNEAEGIANMVVLTPRMNLSFVRIAQNEILNPLVQEINVC